MRNILESFSLNKEKEDFEKIIQSVVDGVEYKGTNLWILVFAIFIASLGLNVNSSAVVIGAMLISPLMGPIMGLGMGMAINDLSLLRKALYNYVFALAIGLVTSTIFFLITPIREASTEILARTSPNIYDVPIAFFGGLAGILAVSSRRKANVIPGVAIAIAVMPPLCTAGYALANRNLVYFTGALYLFVINTVFIALATLVTARFLRFPYKVLPTRRDEVVANRIVWLAVVLTILPSVYLGYDFIQQNRFRQNANRFVEMEAVFPNDYLLKKSIDPRAKKITLTYGGEYISEDRIEALRARLSAYGLENTELNIEHGFAYANNVQENDRETQLSVVLNDKEKELRGLRDKLAAVDARRALGKQIVAELRVQYPTIVSAVVQEVENNDATSQTIIWVAIIRSDAPILDADRKKLADWLKVRISTPDVTVYFDETKPTPSPAVLE